MALSMLMVAMENIEPEIAASVAIAGGVLALIVAGLFTYQLKSYNDGSVAFRKEGEWVRPLPSKDAENGQPSAFYVPGCENWSAEQKKNFQFGAPNGKKISDIVQYVTTSDAMCCRGVDGGGRVCSAAREMRTMRMWAPHTHTLMAFADFAGTVPVPS